MERKRRISAIWIAVLLLLALAVTAGAQEAAECALSWTAEEGTLRLSGLLQVQDPAFCIASVYRKNGQMVSVGIECVPEGADELTLSLPESMALEEYTMWVYLTDARHRPVCAAQVWNCRSVAATCEKKGYTVISGTFGGTQICNFVPALGHRYGEWRVTAEPEGISCGEKERSCRVCGSVDRAAVYPETTLPVLRLYGSLEGIDRKTEVSLQAQFDGAGQSFAAYATLKYQGHSSTVYEKKNYTIKFFQDETHETRLKVKFYDWNKDSKFILKANYIDPSQCRNLVCADIWSEICKTRDGTKHIKKLFNYGAVDGLPSAVYLNDTFLGLYDLTLHKDDDLFKLKSGEQDALMILNRCTSDAALFRAEAAFDDACDWEVEFCGTEDRAWAQEKLNAFARFVMTASDAEFSNNKTLKKYVNIDSAVDYLLAIYALGLHNSYAKNLVLVSYDDGTGVSDPWICSLFDMEDAFGLSPDGQRVLDAVDGLPEKTDGIWTSGTGSLLWDRLLQCYETRIRARYTQLRAGVLSQEAIMEKVRQFTAQIPEVYYAADAARYPGMPQQPGGAEQQIEQYLSQRLALLDARLLNEEAGGTEE